VIREIKAAGMTILLVEQNLYSPRVADRCYILDQGEVVYAGVPDDLRGTKTSCAVTCTCNDRTEFDRRGHPAEWQCNAPTAR